MGIKNQDKERVIIYSSPQKGHKSTVELMGLNDIATKLPVSLDHEEDTTSPPQVATIKAIHPQMVMNKLKPIKDDFMNYYGAQNSISQLSFNVNDAAGGKTFDSCYEKHDVLGEGGFAIVYRCFHYERMHTYAVKEILKDDYECSGENLKEEIDALKRLRDIPYIVRLMDVFHGNNMTHVVMEEMKGGDLLERLCEIEVFNETDARKLSRRLLEALYYCHKKNIVHRDVKPENILMSSKDNNTLIKLADFGCSRRFEPGTNSLHTLCGSPQYVAPELYTHTNGYDERCDLWSVAVVIYVILGGYAPFDGEDHELPSIICDGYFEFHEKYWSEVSEQPKDLIRSLLKVNSNERATLEDALDSEWLRRRDKDKLESVKNLNGSRTSFEAWCRSQNSDFSGSQTESLNGGSLHGGSLHGGSIHGSQHSPRPPTMDLVLEDSGSSISQSSQSSLQPDDLAL